MIGNDLVDLNNLPPHPRFLKRVFTEEEQEWILSQGHPEKALWTLWAVKEATFKAISKRDRTCRFLHREFVVDPTVWRCSHQNCAAHIELSTTEHFVHAIALLDPLQWRILAHKIGPSIDADKESESVRKLAQTMLESLGYDHSEISQRPPAIHRGGQRVKELEISLSHDGRYLAVVIGTIIF